MYNRVAVDGGCIAINELSTAAFYFLRIAIPKTHCIGIRLIRRGSAQSFVIVSGEGNQVGERRLGDSFSGNLPRPYVGSLTDMR